MSLYLSYRDLWQKTWGKMTEDNCISIFGTGSGTVKN
ncbi:hypothetical protein B6N60_02998 [Richelia sinica FACHB-800]|uniref:Uncharacterized protein n=1 Tax=Richelia sinica FACHB-800 TaxID=1357546 RepID=A0A975T926_9NOST|nr:hypothetical protein B6N60_02998 [Richelia sinica FACHB-800]